MRVPEDEHVGVGSRGDLVDELSRSIRTQVIVTKRVAWTKAKRVPPTSHVRHSGRRANQAVSAASSWARVQSRIAGANGCFAGLPFGSTPQATAWS